VGDGVPLLVVTTLPQVDRVAVWCDDQVIAVLDAPPYTAQLGTKRWSMGSHLVRVVAFLKDGKQVRAEPVAVALVPRGESIAVEPVMKAGLQPQVIKAGASVSLRLMEPLVSGFTEVGKVVRFVVAREALGPGQEILIEQGTRALGKVTESKGCKLFGKRARLSLLLETATAVDGAPVTLGSSHGFRGERGSIIVPAISWIAMGSEVKDVRVSPGTEVPAAVGKDTPVQPSMIRATGPETPSGESMQLEVKGGKEVKGRRRLRAGEILSFRATASPPEKVRYLRVLVNSIEVMRRDTLNADCDGIDTKGFNKGKQELTVDVVFTDGFVLGQSAAFDIY